MLWSDRRSKIVLWIASLIYVALFSAIAAWKFFNFRYTAIDLAIFTQTVARTAAGDFFGLSIHPPSYLGDHFSPALALLAIPFRVWPHPLVLLFTLQIALAAGAWPVYRIARAHFNPLWALALAIAYLANPFTQNLSLFEFHFVAFAVPLLLWAAAAYQKHRFGEFAAWCALALLIREDVALVVGSFSVLALIERRPRKWTVLPAALAVLWLPLAFAAIRAAAPAGGYKFSIYYAWLWPTLVLHPFRVLAHFLRLANFEMIAGMLLPFAFLPLRQPATLLLTAAPFLQILLGEPGGSALILKTQYVALFLPALFVAYIQTLGKLRDRPLRIFGPVFRDWRLGAAVATTAVLYGSLTLGPVWESLRLMLAQGWRSQASRWQSALLAKLPPDAAVAASYAFLPQVATHPESTGLNYAFIGRQQLSELPFTLPEATQAVIVDLSEFLTYQLQYKNHRFYGAAYADAAARLRQRLTDDGFAVTAVADRFALLRRNAPACCRLWGVLHEAPAGLVGPSSRVTSALEFLGWRRITPAPGPLLPALQLPLALYWQRQEPLQENYYFRLVVAGKTLPTFYPLGSGFLPAPDWPTGAVVESSYWFARPQTIPDAPVAIQLYAILDGGVYLAADLATETRVTKSEKIGPAIALGTVGELSGSR